MKVIFIMGNDAQLLAVLEMLLSRKGYQVVTAGPSNEIYKLIGQYKPDLIILDDKMGSIQGTTLCGAIKNSDKFKQLPVLIFNSDPEILDGVINSGCNLVLSKTVDVASLISEIEILLYPSNTKKR